MAEIRTTPMPQVGRQRSPVLDRPAARQEDYGFTPAAPVNRPVICGGCLV